MFCRFSDPSFTLFLTTVPVVPFSLRFKAIFSGFYCFMMGRSQRSSRNDISHISQLELALIGDPVMDVRSGLGIAGLNVNFLDVLVLLGHF